ncbi:MAG TPA: 2-oxoglutarate dehydrogenase E1 component [Candidatus Hydrogenedentes bacterium]|jgi:2-oxoglutarate dehydrogenase E1 component|nr:2-oxoglutarate dehydrogenase E1 component [Candidatus Hydrogenedentota bacterium]HPJ98227.1 2-oxoglutarate dehydrogenase E1 component [Candidatus Hydrogenedentota bacterium]
MANPETELSSLSLEFMEGLYEQYLDQPDSIPADWREYFRRLSDNGDFTPAPAVPQDTCVRRRWFQSDWEEAIKCQICGRDINLAAMQHKVDKLVRNYRVRGHRVAQVDPLRSPVPELEELDPAYFGFSDHDMDLPFSTTTLTEEDTLSLAEIIERLRNTYCRSIGVQFMHIDDLDLREWLQERMERTENRIALSRNEQIRILTRLTDAVIFEEFIQKKYVGAKRFSLEGAESLIPLLDMAIEKAGQYKIDEIVIGMAHRGRLNVLTNILGKSPGRIFREFDDEDPELHIGRGDVKYHLGHHSDWTTEAGHTLHLALCFNPSHLEFVNPVAMGRVRAKQDRLGDVRREGGMCLLIHGDAAFAGEGIVQESLNLSQLEGYRIGGTIHVVVNNQIGFTTVPSEGRSSVYATDVAKMLQIPIFHVNGEDPEAVAQVIDLAMEFRRKFQRDVVIDMYCYRRHGHNETDEPAFTQPLLYAKINRRRSVREGYLEHLLKLGGISREEADEIAERRRAVLEKEFTASRSKEEEQAREERKRNPKRKSVLGVLWSRYFGGPEKNAPNPDTGVARDTLVSHLEALTVLPDGFHVHPKARRLLTARKAMAAGKQPLDWAAGEALAYASLAAEGVRVRMSGQDSQRGTFSHRHAVLVDTVDGRAYMPLQHITPEQGPVDIVNSPLSEAGVLGFEYGYSSAYPDGLVLWEAQFGDFANAAQVLIDQGITSAEDKWGALSGLVLLLPHGFEGMGPEHSSARLERFLMLGAEDNIQVVYPTTPAQFFHCLRRQVHRPWRKPLIVMTPKSLLRHPKVVSPLEDLARGRFRHILPDEMGIPGDRVKRVLLCSGKIYYELVEERAARGRDDVAIVRVEQLFPLHEEYLEEVLRDYPAETDMVWVQEEPQNMGAWWLWRVRFCDRLLGRWPLRGVYRAPSASPATGSAASHRLEQRLLLDEAFADL